MDIVLNKVKATFAIDLGAMSDEDIDSLSKAIAEEKRTRSDGKSAALITGWDAALRYLVDASSLNADWNEAKIDRCTEVLLAAFGTKSKKKIAKMIEWAGDLSNWNEEMQSVSEDSTEWRELDHDITKYTKKFHNAVCHFEKIGV